MKKFLCLTVLAMVLGSSMGCECGGLFRRGSLFPRLRGEEPCYEPCATPCDTPCATGGCGAPAATMPAISAAPETFATPTPSPVAP